MFSRAWEQAGLLSNDSSLCACSKPRALQEEVLVVFLWGSIQAPPRKRKIDLQEFLAVVWHSLSSAESRVLSLLWRLAAATMLCQSVLNVNDCAVPGVPLFSVPC